MNSHALAMWTVYDHPKDYPNSFVARRWEVGTGTEPIPTDSIVISPDLKSLRGLLTEMGLTPLGRSVEDDAAIIETWI